MAEDAYRIQPGTMVHRTDWKAVWAGTFIFYAIWVVFGALGVAIFASNTNPNANAPVLGQSVGMGIWTVVLTIIAMYVAGRETGRMADVQSRHDGLIHGLIMFGLAVTGLIVLASIGGSAIAQGNAVPGTSHNPFAITVVADLGWAGFVALFLGWLAAMSGASAGVTHKVEPPRAEPRPIRTAA
jgi:hypothetical protein